MALSYNQDVEDRRASLKLPAALAAGSFFILLILLFFTSPIDKVGISILFFAALFLLLNSVGYLLVGLQAGRVNAKSRSRIVISSVFLLIILMFRSAGSLGLVDAIVLIAITTGLLFYSSRRSS